MLDPTMVGRTGRIAAITWNVPNGIDKLGVIALPLKPRYMRWRNYRRLERLVLQLEPVGSEAMSAHVYAIHRRRR
jgi:hypothetical protein